MLKLLNQNNLLFYDFNAGSRKFTFGAGNNGRLATKGEFRRTGMAGAKFLNNEVIDPNDLEAHNTKRRPTTSQFRGGDRLPSRASKTRERARRIQIAANKMKAPSRGPNKHSIVMSSKKGVVTFGSSEKARQKFQNSTSKI